MAYEQIYKVSIVMAVIMSGMALFMPYYVVSAETEQVQQVPRSKKEIVTHLGEKTTDYRIRKPWDNCRLYDLPNTNLQFNFYIDRTTDEVKTEFREVDEERRLATYFIQEFPLPSTSGVLDTDLISYTSRYKPNRGMPVYLEMEEIMLENEGLTKNTWTVKETDTDNIKAYRDLGQIRITIYTETHPDIESGTRTGYLDVIRSMFTFQVPLIPQPLNIFISSIMWVALGFIIFGAVLKIAPIIG